MKNIISNMIVNRMERSSRVLFMICLLGMLLNVNADVRATHAKLESPAVLDSVTLLKNAKNNDEKLKYLDEINHLYMDNAMLILNKLRYDIANHLKDGGYCSPLHLSLRAVSCWHVRSAMDDLLKIIDYKLDPQTIPHGGDMLEDYLHPVLRVLINLGIESETIVRTIANAESKERICLLLWTWGHLKGVRKEEMPTILEKESVQYPEEKQQKNLRLAADYLKKAEHISDLIRMSEETGKTP